MGAISAIGNSPAQMLDSLLSRRSGVGSIEHLVTAHHEFPCGEVKLSNDQMVSLLGLPSDGAYTRTFLLGALALRQAIGMAGLKAEELPECGFVNGTTVGGMDKSELYYTDFRTSLDHKEYIATHDCGACSDMIAEQAGRFAFVTTLSTACSSAANAIILVANMIEAGECEMAVAGGSECITKYHLNGFNTLKILDTAQCRPIDQSRAGINLGEGAAYLVIETAESAARRGAQPLCVLSGWGNACDAFHQTATSPEGEGAYRAMNKALDMAGLNPGDIAYINAHGTGTVNNDETEAAALLRVFGKDNSPWVSSTKSYTGHTTSASGSIESVICILAMQHGFVPASLGLAHPIDVGNLRFSNAVEQQPLGHVMCNSFGFGGNDSSLIFSAVSEKPDQPRSVDSADASDIFIRAAEQISCQKPLSEEWLTTPDSPDAPYQRSVDPNFRDFFPPLVARKMGRLIKRAVVTSLRAMEHSGIAAPDAIVTGTGLGCVENTELFLTALTDHGEELLQPTQFMQSTHNTIGSMIAIHTGNHGYNATYSQKSASMESALLDAYTQMRLGAIDSALVGAHDEVTPTYYTLLEKIGYVGANGQTPCCEASASIMLGREKEGSLCRLDNVRMASSPTKEELFALVSQSVPDVVMLGLNGNEANDRPYADILNLLGDVSMPAAQYKSVFGECYSASGLGLYALAHCLDRGVVPAHMSLSGKEITGIKTALFINHSDGLNFAFVKLSK